MANPAEVASQVRFALSQLPAQNAHHVFEHICRHLTEQFICSNVLPATGPVSAGGDQGRDFETFRTYLRDELGPHGAFLALASDEVIAFTCTIQSQGLAAKVRDDVETVCSSGHPVSEIRAFTLEAVPVGTRHSLQEETQREYNVRLELHDAESIADLLSKPEGFWIAEQFLAMPAEVRPEVLVGEEELPTEYLERRDRWREDGTPNLTLGDFLDLKAGLRESVHREVASTDLPFWLGRMRALLASPGLHPSIQQRARYELVVATLRATRNLQPVDGVTREFLTDSLQETEPARLEDAGTLLMYVNGAIQHGITSITPAEFTFWNSELRNLVERLIRGETSHRRASLLHTLGFLSLQPMLNDEEPDESLQLETGFGDVDEEFSASVMESTPYIEGYALCDAPRALSAWIELVENIDATPLYPIQPLANLVQLMMDLWSTDYEWRRLLDLIDEEIEKRSGKNAVAERARDRAMALMDSDRHLEALEEFHRVKVDWWSGDTVRGSVLAVLIIAKLYRDLRLFSAAKAYATAAAAISATHDDDDMADLISPGLLMAANCEFAMGAWFSAAKLFGLGLVAQYHNCDSGIDLEGDELVQAAVLHLAYISISARHVDPALHDTVLEIVARTGLEGVIDELVGPLLESDSSFWGEFGEGALSAPPFSDLGRFRSIRFAALGTEWTLLVENNAESVSVAERLAAGAETMLAALARDDLCLVPTKINVQVKTKPQIGADSSRSIEALPSNDGREWVVWLSPSETAEGDNQEDINIELMTVLATILREISLLPDSDFDVVMKQAFRHGLGHKLSPAYQFERWAEAAGGEQDGDFTPQALDIPWDTVENQWAIPDKISWQDGSGPTYSVERARELLETRYHNLSQGLRITTVALSHSEQFRPTLESLRERGWLDWHILTAIMNITLNHRFLRNGSSIPSDQDHREIMEAAFNPESAAATRVPAVSFTYEAMELARQASMLSLLIHWGLECHQRTPDFEAIENLLAARYGYWDEDIPHEDPFTRS